MAIRATHITLSDLSPDACPTPVHQETDVGNLLLRIPVIEFEHDGIRDSAIDARMRRQIAQHFAAILGTLRLDLGDGSPDVVRLVREIMAVPVGGVTRAAVCVKQATGLI